MLNPQFNYRAPQTLVVPQGNAGWQTIGTLWNGAAGLMTYLDAKKRAEKMDKAQNDYYEALKAYLNNERNEFTKGNDSAAKETTPAATTAPTVVQPNTPEENVSETPADGRTLDEALNEEMAKFRYENETPYQRALKNFLNYGGNQFGFLGGI